MSGSAGSGGTTGSARKRIMKEEDMTKVEFETSEEVDVTPTFDTMGLREDLLRGIYAYGARRGGRGEGGGERAGVREMAAAMRGGAHARRRAVTAVSPQGSRSRRPSSREPSSRSSRAAT